MQKCLKFGYIKTYNQLKYIRTSSKLFENKEIQVIVTKCNYKTYTPMETPLLNQLQSHNIISYKNLTTAPEEAESVESRIFEKVCEETLDSLSEYFEEIIESEKHLETADVQYSSGVLTVNFGKPYGTYVINRQSPNRQIWLSSPISGPKRYDYSIKRSCWIYKHDGKSMHQLLQNEVSKIVKNPLDFSKCSHSSV